MKAVILAGGWGMRLREQTVVKPKPMVEIGQRPILWHIMKIYSAHGINDFILCLGYKGHLIKDFFANYALYNSVVTFDMAAGQLAVHQNSSEPWRVTLVDTGLNTNTGGRLKRVSQFLGDEDFCMTYGDGVGDIDISETIRFHNRHGRMATVTAARPPARFGALNIDGDCVKSFEEKPTGDGRWINGGFFVLKPSALEAVAGDETQWESSAMEQLARDAELMAYRHNGFWQPMDTVRDMDYLEELWQSGEAPWKIW